MSVRIVTAISAVIILLVSFRADAQGNIVIGEWINESTMDTLRIEPDGRIYLDIGSGRLTRTTMDGANVIFSGETFNCSYNARTTDSKTFYLRLVAQNKGRCPSGKFVRVGNDPNRANGPPPVLPMPPTSNNPPRCIINQNALPPGTPISSCDGMGPIGAPCNCAIAGNNWPGTYGVIGFRPGVGPYRMQ